MIQNHGYVQCSKYIISNCTQNLYNCHTYCIKTKLRLLRPYSRHQILHNIKRTCHMWRFFHLYKAMTNLNLVHIIRLFYRYQIYHLFVSQSQRACNQMFLGQRCTCFRKKSGSGASSIRVKNGQLMIDFFLFIFFYIKFIWWNLDIFLS